MDDNNNKDVNSATASTKNPYESAVSPATGVSESSQAGQASAQLLYAGFWQRFLAALIDGVLVAIVSGVISAVFGAIGDSARSLGSLLGMAVGYAYYVYFISQKGATLGKQALGLRVQNMETGQNLDVVSAVLREVVGKFISGLVLMVGYLWMLWDDKKQTWHDKIAKSVVVKIK